MNILIILACADAVRRNPLTCRATDADIASVVKEWLKHARDRDGGRSRRSRASGATAAPGSCP